MGEQQGDVRLFQTHDGGEMVIEDGLVSMDGGLETAAYLSLFGGNEDDDGSPGNSMTWWANLGENQPDRQYRSEAQHLLQSLNPTSGNLRRIEDAAGRDLAWMVGPVATSVSASASVVGLNRVKIAVSIEADGPPSRFEFFENWKASE